MTEMKNDFQFVSVVPTADGRAKPSRQVLVRKNAAKYQWRRNKTTKGKAPVGKAPVGKDSVARTSRDDRAVILVERDDEVPDSGKQDDTRSYGLHESRLSLQIYYNMSFAQDEKFAKSMSFNTQVMLPALMPSSKPNVEHPGNKAWLQMATSDPLLFQVWIYHTEMHYRVMFERPLDSECDLFMLYSQIIKSLNERMQNAETACSDVNILCVSGLAVYGGKVFTPTARTRWPSQGPLKYLNGTNTYSQMRSAPEHYEGQNLLIRLRGGLENIKRPGLAPMLSLSDINESMRRLIPIRHPFIPWNEGSVILERPEDSERLLDSMPNIGRGFPADWKHSDFKPLRDLFTALRYMAAYTAVVHNHCQGMVTYSAGALADTRNSIQHRLLSVPTYPYEQDTEAPHQLYESTRLAAQMYSLLAVCPCHPSTAPFEELAILLRKELSSLDLSNTSYEELPFLIWILVMGAIVTVGTKDRSWFIAALNPVSQRLQLNSWDDMKHVLTTFLWLDMTNDIDGREVWDEVNLLQCRHKAVARFSSSPSVSSSKNMIIRTRSRSPEEIAETPAAIHTFSTPCELVCNDRHSIKKNPHSAC